jgi:hypothetical protein
MREKIFMEKEVDDPKKKVREENERLRRLKL